MRYTVRPFIKVIAMAKPISIKSKSQVARSAVDKNQSQVARSAVDKNQSQVARSAVDKNMSVPAALPAQSVVAWLAVVRAYQLCDSCLSQQIAAVNLSMPQFDVLLALATFGPQTQQQITERSYIAKSRLSGLLTQMETLGWIARSGSGEDGRAKIVALTRAGGSLASQAKTIQKNVMWLMTAGLSEREIETTKIVMDKVANTLSMELDRLQPKSRKRNVGPG
jgi:DNA-binding MarR family transcriptional regulator